jgi:hypothetical protein
MVTRYTQLKKSFPVTRFWASRNVVQLMYLTWHDGNSRIFLLYDLWHVWNPTEILSGEQLFCFTLGFSQIKEPMDVLWMNFFFNCATHECAVRAVRYFEKQLKEAEYTYFTILCHFVLWCNEIIREFIAVWKTNPVKGLNKLNRTIFGVFSKDSRWHRWQGWFAAFSWQILTSIKRNQ